jgi:hypothetical protein
MWLMLLLLHVLMLLLSVLLIGSMLLLRGGVIEVLRSHVRVGVVRSMAMVHCGHSSTCRGRSLMFQCSFSSECGTGDVLHALVLPLSLPLPRHRGQA